MCLTSVCNVTATAICHTVPAILQGKTVSVSSLFCYPLNRLELKQWTSGFVGIDCHSHWQDARRPGWIDLTMKTTTTSRQTSPHISYIHIHTLRHKEKITSIPLTKKFNKRNAQITTDDNSTTLIGYHKLAITS